MIFKIWEAKWRFSFLVVAGSKKARTVIEEKGTKEGNGTVTGTEINLFPQNVSLFHLFWWVVPLLHGPSCWYEGRKGARITPGLFRRRVGVKVNITGHHFGGIFEDYAWLPNRKRTQSCNSSPGTPGSVLLHDKWKHFLVMSSARCNTMHLTEPRNPRATRSQTSAKTYKSNATDSTERKFVYFRITPLPPHAKQYRNVMTQWVRISHIWSCCSCWFHQIPLLIW